MSDIRLGTLIATPELPPRDAIHIAIAPVIAGETLYPGDHIGLLPSGEASKDKDIIKIGIVDPFLPKGMSLSKGTKFYMCLYQLTVTGMRHHWSHPAFNEEYSSIPDKEFSINWITKHAKERGFSYDQLMNFAKEDFAVGQDDGVHIEPEFWIHYQIITGQKGSGSTYFSCSC